MNEGRRIQFLLMAVFITAILGVVFLNTSHIASSQEPDPACTLTFNIGALPTSTPTPTPIPECWDICSSDSDCPSSLDCQNVSGTNRCVNPICPTESDCTCPEATPTPTPPPPPPGTTPTPTPPPPPPGTTPTPTPVPVELPEAGIISPTLLATIGGLILVILGLLL